ncbi:hypothetical protein BLOT_011520 [Blomia tropicalis]|nr:hypothetical protein BLOT_011520 [Blomia tropicalis]
MMNTHVSFHLYDLVFDNCLIIFDTRDHNETLETNEKSQPILSAAAANSVSNLSYCKLRQQLAPDLVARVNLNANDSTQIHPKPIYPESWLWMIDSFVSFQISFFFWKNVLPVQIEMIYLLIQLVAIQFDVFYSRYLFNQPNRTCPNIYSMSI